MDNLINYNGTIINSSEFLLTPENRGFTFGDGFFESIWIINGHIPLWNYHFTRIIRSGKLLSFESVKLLSPIFLRNEIFRIVPSTGMYRVKFSFYRVSSGKYLPDYNSFKFLIQYTEGIKPFPSMELKIGKSQQVVNSLSGNWKQIKSLSAISYVIGALEAKAQQKDDLCILTEDGRISESTNSNIFVIKNEIIYTPTIHTGCINGVFRSYLIDLLRDKGIRIVENDLFWSDINEFDEMFLTNAVQWIRPVTQINDRKMPFPEISHSIINLVGQDLLEN